MFVVIHPSPLAGKSGARSLRAPPQCVFRFISQGPTW